MVLPFKIDTKWFLHFVTCTNKETKFMKILGSVAISFSTSTDFCMCKCQLFRTLFFFFVICFPLIKKCYGYLVHYVRSEVLAKFIMYCFVAKLQFY